jgi:DNA invertase Pin-like site-specific DNA recombinase
MTDAGVYARKSSDDSDKNEEARSTTRQVERATEYARARGWTVDPAHVFVDEMGEDQESSCAGARSTTPSALSTSGCARNSRHS